LLTEHAFSIEFYSGLFYETRALF